MSLTKIKDVVESNPVSFATVTDGNRPNVIGVAFVKVFDNHTVIVTDNYMHRTVTDISENNNVCLLVWNDSLHGYKLIGTASYHTSGKWKKFIDEMEENSGLPAKGAIVVKVSKVIESH